MHNFTLIQEKLLDSRLGALLVFMIRSLRISTLGIILKTFEYCDTLLDLGCGESSPLCKLKDFTFSVGIDINFTSLQKNKAKKYLKDYIRADLRYLPFKNNSFDCITALDVVEHFGREDGWEFLKHMDELSSKVLFIQTPNGYCPINSATNVYDAHKSSWFVNDFEKLGFTVLGRHGHKKLRGLRGNPILKPKLIGEVVSSLSQLIFYNRPSYCFHLLAFKIKSINNNSVKIRQRYTPQGF